MALPGCCTRTGWLRSWRAAFPGFFPPWKIRFRWSIEEPPEAGGLPGWASSLWAPVMAARFVFITMSTNPFVVYSIGIRAADEPLW